MRLYTHEFDRRRAPPTNWTEALWQIACVLARIVTGRQRRATIHGEW